MPRSPRVTAAQVAERAGLSVATVSLVLNGKTDGRVSAANIDRVHAAVAELGYVIDRGASALARGRSDLIVLVAPDLSNPFFGAVIRGIEAELGERFQLLLSVTASGVQPTAADVGRFAGLRPAGLLVDAPSDAFLAELSGDEPLVLLDAPDPRAADARAADARDADARASHARATHARASDARDAATGIAPAYDAVNYDMSNAIDRLVAHLAALGHSSIGYLDSTTGTTTFDLRREQLVEAATARGLTVNAPDAARSVIEMGAAASAFVAAWPALNAAGVTAVVCATDTHAYGALEAARSLGLSVPGDLAITGFDDLPYSRVTSPSLTTIRLPGEPLGRAAARRLLAQIDGTDAASGDPALVATLVVRGSTDPEA